jgi:hypothetical protein
MHSRKTLLSLFIFSFDFHFTIIYCRLIFVINMKVKMKIQFNVRRITYGNKKLILKSHEKREHSQHKFWFYFKNSLIIIDFLTYHSKNNFRLKWFNLYNLLMRCTKDGTACILIHWGKNLLFIHFEL